MEEADIKKTEQLVNDYIMDMGENSLYFENLGICASIAQSVLDTFKEYFDNDNNQESFIEKLDKMSIFDSINLVKIFYKECGINLDIDELIKDGTIDFAYYDELEKSDISINKNEYNDYGACHFEKGKYYINTINGNTLLDSRTLIHELSHYQNCPSNERTDDWELISETLAITEELIFCDFLFKKGFEESARLLIKDRVLYTYNSIDYLSPIYAIFFVYKKYSNLSKQNYNLIFDDPNYDNEMKKTKNSIENKEFNFERHNKYILSFELASYMLSQYKKDNNFIEIINSIHNKINSMKVTEFIKAIGLNDLGTEDRKIIRDSLEELKSDLENTKEKTAKSSR